MTDPAFTLNREAVETWIDSGARVFAVFLTPRGDRIASTGKVIRCDAAGVAFSTSHDREGRGTFVRFEHIVTLRLAASTKASSAPLDGLVAIDGNGSTSVVRDGKWVQVSPPAEATDA